MNQLGLQSDVPPRIGFHRPWGQFIYQMEEFKIFMTGSFSYWLNGGEDLLTDHALLGLMKRISSGCVRAMLNSNP